jgi:NAD-dependent SIR2 family protein deacetylase
VSLARDPDADAVRDAADVLAAGDVLVLTGAGVSTDSGIPDYRGPDRLVVPTPMTMQQLRSGPEAMQRYWARAHLGWARMGHAEPNATHHALVRWQEEGRLTGLVTQNVDGLHEKAGHRDVVDLHGRVDRVVCMDCGDLTPRTEVQERHERLNPGWSAQTVVHGPDGDVQLDDTSHFVVAPCRVCGGRLRPDVVFFGGSVPKPVVEHCFALVERARSLLVLGSSLQVMSGLRFVRRAAALGTPVVIVNRGPTRGDDLADVRLDAGCAQTVQELALAFV